MSGAPRVERLLAWYQLHHPSGQAVTFAGTGKLGLQLTGRRADLSEWLHGMPDSEFTHLEVSKVLPDSDAHGLVSDGGVIEAVQGESVVGWSYSRIVDALVQPAQRPLIICVGPPKALPCAERQLDLLIMGERVDRVNRRVSGSFGSLEELLGHLSKLLSLPLSGLQLSLKGELAPLQGLAELPSKAKVELWTVSKSPASPSPSSPVAQPEPEMMQAGEPGAAEEGVPPLRQTHSLMMEPTTAPSVGGGGGGGVHTAAGDTPPLAGGFSARASVAVVPQQGPLLTEESGRLRQDGRIADWYVGELSADGTVPHGHGEYTWANGTTFDGEWESGVPRRGVLQCANGTWFEGGWQDGKTSGTGTLKRTLADGATYYGGVLNGEAHGQGTRRAMDGSSYTGAWLEGLPHGQGRETAANGQEWYDGEWVAGKRTGQGRWRVAAPHFGAGRGGWLSGSSPVLEVVSGEFLEGVPVGACEVRCDDHSVMEVAYQEGAPLVGRDPHRQGHQPVRIRWAGGGGDMSWEGWLDAGLLDSKKASAAGVATGVLTVPSGVIEGEFRHRLSNGNLRHSAVPGSVRYMVPLSGKHTWPDGVVYEGTFDGNGDRHGAGATTLPNGLVHTGQYVHGAVDYRASCTLTVAPLLAATAEAAAAAEGAEAGAVEPLPRGGEWLEPGEHKGRLTEDMRWHPKGKAKRAQSIAGMLQAPQGCNGIVRRG